VQGKTIPTKKKHKNNKKNSSPNRAV